VIVIGTPITVTNGASTSATASCAAGHVLLGGGGIITTTDTAGKAVLTASYPSASTTWTATGAASSLARGRNWTIKAYAVCTA
jgi:hypothetical protein